MAHGILIMNSVQAMTIDALNRSVVCVTDDIDNGSVLTITGVSSAKGHGEVFTAATPTTGSLSDLWMACEPEVVVTVTGDKKYKGINPDVKDFYNPKGEVFTAFKPQVGDIITISADGLAGTKGANTYVVATNNSAKLTWASSAVNGLSLKLLETTYISVADGSIGTQRVTAYRFEVVAIA